VILRAAAALLLAIALWFFVRVQDPYARAGRASDVPRASAVPDTR